MVDLASAQAQAKGWLPPPTTKGGGANRGRCGHTPKCATTRHDRHTQWQAPGAAAYRPLRETPRRGLPKPCVPVKHKLMDCGVMKNFIISGFLTWGMELDEDSCGRGTMPFPGEEAVMTVYDGCPHQEGAV
jgi:hypothetical protein